jgi:hypothetical protein
VVTPPARLDDLWRSAGGGTRDFDPIRFRALADEAAELAAPPTCPDCAGRSASLCWFAAAGLTVMRERQQARRRKPRPAPEQLALFLTADPAPRRANHLETVHVPSPMTSTEDQ